MIDYSKSLNIIEEIKNLDLGIEESYPQIMRLISQMYIPYDVTIQKKGSWIFRARKHSSNDKFNFKELISYNKDYRKITEFGRANEIRQSVFYASNKVETAIIETSSLISNTKLYKGKENFTVGRWRAIEDINLIAMVSNEEANRINEIIKELYNVSLKHDLSNSESNQIRKFFSDEFAKKVNGDSNLYKISCAFFNRVMFDQDTKSFGVLYPSVGYEYKDLNVALLPVAVENFLVLDSIIEYELNMEDSSIKPIALIDIKAWTSHEMKIE